MSARECRLRKKLKETEILQQIAFYETENLNLRLKLKLGSDVNKLNETESKNFIKKLETMVKTISIFYKTTQYIQDLINYYFFVSQINIPYI